MNDSQRGSISSVKSWHKSLTIQASGIIALLQMVPEIVAEINSLTSVDITANPLVIKITTMSAAIVAIYGRVRAGGIK